MADVLPEWFTEACRLAGLRVGPMPFDVLRSGLRPLFRDRFPVLHFFPRFLHTVGGVRVTVWVSGVTVFAKRRGELFTIPSFAMLQ